MKILFIPQMNPMNWLILLLYFNFLFLVTLSKIHFTNLFLFSLNSKKSFLGSMKMNLKI